VFSKAVVPKFFMPPLAGGKDREYTPIYVGRPSPSEEVRTPISDLLKTILELGSQHLITKEQIKANKDLTLARLEAMKAGVSPIYMGEDYYVAPKKEFEKYLPYILMGGLGLVLLLTPSRRSTSSRKRR